MMKIVAVLILTVLMVGCSSPEFDQGAYDTAYSNKCWNGEGAPVKPYDWSSQTEDWKNFYHMAKAGIKCR